MRRTAKPMPFAIRMTELTGFVPLPQGKTHSPDARESRQDDPGPRTGSYPASVARVWNILKEDTLEYWDDILGPVQGTTMNLHRESPWIACFQYPSFDEKKSKGDAQYLRSRTLRLN